ncbi:MAG: hypothetical protein NVSMB62_17070 [Acidobacteriaceae bacterium]
MLQIIQANAEDAGRALDWRKQRCASKWEGRALPRDIRLHAVRRSQKGERVGESFCGEIDDVLLNYEAGSSGVTTLCKRYKLHANSFHTEPCGNAYAASDSGFIWMLYPGSRGN